MPAPLQFGKILTEESYHNGELTTEKRYVEESVAVDGYVDTLTKIGAIIKKVETAQNHKVVIEVSANPKTNEPTRIAYRYQTERNK